MNLLTKRELLQRTHYNCFQ